MATKFLEELSNDYKKLFETKIGYDVIIYAGEEPNIKEFHVHSNILCIRSQYFHSAFSNEWAEKKDGKFIFKKPNITPQLFNIILRFIYYGIIELEKLQIPDILELLIAVDELNINSLISHIQEFLIEHQPEFLLQCKIEIIEAIHQYESFTDLCNFYLEKICEEPKTLFGSDKFINLKASLLEVLLKRNDLIIDEIEIWEYVLKWSFAQQNIKNDPTKWISYVDKQNCAIYCHINYGPAMGNLLCRDNNWHYDNYDDGNRYPKIGIPTNFEIDDYEVFQVIKN
ncbi:unnamed protein product [Rhizophagus irregularis]|nr:unnamed protein product [Rhizophagus irregularis]